MLRYTVRTDKKFDKQLSKIGEDNADRIRRWIIDNLEGSTNPKKLGKALAGRKRREWRWRVGNYRIMGEVLERELIILLLEVGHRREVYK